MNGRRFNAVERIKETSKSHCKMNPFRRPEFAQVLALDSFKQSAH